MKDRLGQMIKEDMNQTKLPEGFDQRFMQKLESLKESKKEGQKLESSRPMKVSPSLWETLLSYLAPVGLAGSMATLIIFWSLSGQSNFDLEGRGEILSNLQTQEIQDLSTLSDSEWDQLLDAAEGAI